MFTRFLAAGCLLGALAACDSILDVEPEDRLSSSGAIHSAASAQAALIGAYNSLRSTGYYGGTFVFFNDLSANNAEWTGTLQHYGQAASNALDAANPSIETIWSAIYEGIGRANLIIEQVPDVASMPDTMKNRIVGEALFLRALHHHNAVKLWGDVPLITRTITSPTEAAQVTRAPAADVYAQILADLSEAEDLIQTPRDPHRASLGAVRALLARVHLYMGNWAAARDAAAEVLGMGYSLVEDYDDLFTASGTTTSEDILRVVFSAADAQNLGFYYHPATLSGRGEVDVSDDLVAAYSAGDERRAWNIGFHDTGSGIDTYGKKFPTTVGAEDPHVIRLAEVILIKAEAHARLEELEEAVDEYNKIRERAELPPHTLGVEVTDQDDVLAEIFLQRRLELAFEGDWWADLVRTNRATTVLGIPITRTLFPIPQADRDVAPGLGQNDGY